MGSVRVFAATMAVAGFGALVGAPVAGAAGGLLNDVTASLGGKAQSSDTSATDSLTPVVQTVANAAAPVTSAAAPVVQIVATAAAPTVGAVAQTAAPVWSRSPTPPSRSSRR